MSRRDAFNEGRQHESVITGTHIHAIVPEAQVRYRHGEPGGRNHGLDVSIPGVEHIPGAGKVGGRQVGSMSWHPETGRVEGISTEGKFKRQGVATAMWHTAHQLAAQHGIAAPVHSETQTDEGAAWARKAQ